MTWQIWLALLGAAAPFAIAVGCAADDDPGPRDGGARDGASLAPIPESSGGAYCDRTFGVVVQALEQCCSEQDKALADYRFARDGVAANLPLCNAALASSIDKKRMTYDAAKGDACYAAYAERYAPSKCANVIQTYSDPVGGACRQAFRGGGEEGAPCAGNHECVDGLTCVGHTTVADGTCKTPPALGEDCGPGRLSAEAGPVGPRTVLQFGRHPACVAGARCDALTRKCVLGAKLGEDCEEVDCLEGLKCVNRFCAAALAAAGAPCEVGDDCAPGTFCERVDGGDLGICSAKRAAGGACVGATFAAECRGRCDAAYGQVGTCASFCGSP